MFELNKLKAIQVGLASPEKIRAWSHGEVKKSETINYRSQKPEPDGLFCERIFGPSKDYECHCGKYKKIKDQGQICEKCGVEITSKAVRRERMGHIELASPCAHIWYLKGIPSRMGLLLDVPPKQLDEVVYFVSHIVLNPGISKILKYREVLDERTARQEFIAVIKDIVDSNIIDEGSPDYTRAQDIISHLEKPSEPFDFITSSAFISKYTGAEFGMGAEAVQRLLKEVDLEAESKAIQDELKTTVGQKNQKRAKLIKRLEVVEAFRNSNNDPSWMILDVIPVIPPDLRPLLQLDGGRYATSDLNELYRRVITRNARLKKLIEIKSPSVILINEKRMLQEAVDALIDNGRRNKPVNGAGGRALKSLSSSLKGKQGRFRQNLLGKRVDYSGRSVIAVGPTLKMYQCGIPREMAIQLFKPFIASVLIHEGTAPSHKQADNMINHYDERVFDVIERIISEHPVLLNRAPTLHRLGIQAFRPVLVEGRAIRLHPLVCAGFNADFDGDQMAVHVPLSQEAQNEAVDLMLASHNILGPKDGKPICIPSQDMILGNYYLTLEDNIEGFKRKAEYYRSIGDNEEADNYELYSQSEGKVFRNFEEAMLAYETHQIHLHNRIAIPASAIKKSGFTDEMKKCYLITTVGKLIFNSIYPEDFPYLNSVTKSNKKNLSSDLMEFFVPKGTDIKTYIANKPLYSPINKGIIGSIINELFKRYKADETSRILDEIKDLGFKYSTKAGITVSISDIAVLPTKNSNIKEGEEKVEQIQGLYEKGLVTNDERKKLVIDVWTKVKEDVMGDLKKKMAEENENPIFMMSDSGARGSADNFVQLVGMLGLMRKPSGDVIEIPIKSCYREGLNVSEFFIATHGARKGGADTALKTADSGYLTRRLIDVSHSVIVTEEDCGCDHGFEVTEVIDTKENKVIVPLKDRLVGRFTCHSIVDPSTGEIIVPGNTLMDEVMADKVVAAGIKSVEIRSLFTCETKNGVCVHCYGRNLATGELVKVGDAVGIMAAQSIGEPGTQLTMRTFHTGGVASGDGGDITQGLPRVQELLEARTPKGEALISEISGEVTSVENVNGRTKIDIKGELEEKSYLTNYGATARVKVGDHVANGQKLTEGAIDPKQLLEVSDITAVENYILKEVQKVYQTQAGISISDKHLEVVVKQMLRKILVIDGGDTEMLPGIKVDVIDFTDANEKALLAGKRPAIGVPRILGITKAALDTSSFLSSASFQETTKVLTDAAIKCKVDYLRGMKENVMIGKLIPAGTGIIPEDEEEEETETTTHNDSENHIDDKAFDHEEELVFDEDLSNSDDFLVVDDKNL